MLAAAWAALALASPPAPLGAQVRDSIPGVTLGMVYETSYQPALALKPFTGRFGGAGLAPQVEAIVGRDLRYSDRFQVMDSLPGGVLDEGVDYGLWDRLGAVWLVTGQVEGAGEGYVLILELHDVLYGEVRERGRFRLPDASDPDFRMAVHRASDDIVTWATGEPGMAASRIAFSMLANDSVKELWIIDSDGENLRRLTDFGSITLSPTWSADASKIAFMSFKDGWQRIYEMQMPGARVRAVPPVGHGSGHITPAYHPSGDVLAFAVSDPERGGIYTYDVGRDCCLERLTWGQVWEDLSPTFSPDGRRLAFNSSRFGTHTPQIFTMQSQGGDPVTLSPYIYGEGGYFTSPDWSPTNELVAFHGRIRRGTYHILVADVAEEGRRLRQLTWEGNNEDPSFAPDGRHLVFVGERQWGFGLFVVDVATGNLRALLAGRRVTAPDWSPSMGGR